MPGVFRPYTIVDVLGTLNDQSSGNAAMNLSSLTTPLSSVGEVDETLTSSDTVVAYSQANQGWDQESWGIPWS